MEYLYFILFLIIGYLSGSINYAIIITRLVSGKDIRKIGNRNPGGANVGRTIGKLWGATVIILDLLKGFIPMFLARVLLFRGELLPLHFLALAATGIAAIAGHCVPVFYGFKGGRGVATSIGVYLFFVPVELFVSMLIGFAIVMLFIKNVRYRIGRWTPIIFVTITPFLTLASSLSIDIPLFAHLSIGGHGWSTIVSVFLISFSILFINFSFFIGTLKEAGGGPPVDT
ncbi:MAG: glycerol-3-phosphate acyltransferase [Spirochaetes bacterium]|nr:MAG: glycerol-3-phosphate acyltransferase [Spirochaetota bacterium]